MPSVNFRNKTAGATLGINAGAAQLRTYGNPIPYIAPWAAALAMFILALVLRRVLRTDVYAWYWSPLVALAMANLTLVTYLGSRARGKLTNRLATAGVGLAGTWLWYLVGVPHLTWRPLLAYWIAAIPVCGGSMAMTALREGQPGNASMQEKLRSQLDKIRNMNEIKVVDGQVRGRIELEPGETVEEAAPQIGKALASLHDLPATGVQISQRRGESVRVGDFRLAPDDRLARPTPYPGPSIRPGDGGTLLQPCRLGLRRSGPLQLWLPGDARVHRNAAMIQATGMPGAGKSVFIRQLLIEAMPRGEFEYWYLNSRKAHQEPEWVLRGASRVETTVKGVLAALGELRDEAPERSRFLGSRFEQWAPGCGVPFRLIVGDEAADWAVDAEDDLVNIAETWRSLGGVLLLGFQRATGDRFPTSARSNFGSRVCFGVDKEIDASKALPEEVLDAGAVPWVWGAREPGRCYLVAPGVPESEWAEDARTFEPNDQVNRWGKHLVDLRERGTTTILPGATVPPARTESPGENVVDADDLDEVDSVDAAEEILAKLRQEEPDVVDDDLPRPGVPADVAAELAATDPADPIEATGGGMQLRLSPKMPPAQARTFARSYLLQLRAAGAARFKVEDVGEDILSATGYRGSWLSKVLGELVAEEPRWLRRTEDSGFYEFVTLAITRDGA